MGCPLTSGQLRTSRTRRDESTPSELRGTLSADVLSTLEREPTLVLDSISVLLSERFTVDQVAVITHALGLPPQIEHPDSAAAEVDLRQRLDSAVLEAISLSRTVSVRKADPMFDHDSMALCAQALALSQADRLESIVTLVVSGKSQTAVPLLRLSTEECIWLKYLASIADLTPIASCQSSDSWIHLGLFCCHSKPLTIGRYEGPAFLPQQSMKRSCRWNRSTGCCHRWQVDLVGRGILTEDDPAYSWGRRCHLWRVSADSDILYHYLYAEVSRLSHLRVAPEPVRSNSVAPQEDTTFWNHFDLSWGGRLLVEVTSIAFTVLRSTAPSEKISELLERLIVLTPLLTFASKES